MPLRWGEGKAPFQAGGIILERLIDDLAEAGRGFQAGEFGRRSPRTSESSSSAGMPSPETQRQAKGRITKWRLMRPSACALDVLAVARKPDRVDDDLRLLHHLAHERFLSVFARLDHAAGQR